MFKADTCSKTWTICLQGDQDKETRRGLVEKHFTALDKEVKVTTTNNPFDTFTVHLPPDLTFVPGSLPDTFDPHQFQGSLVSITHRPTNHPTPNIAFLRAKGSSTIHVAEQTETQCDAIEGSDISRVSWRTHKRTPGGWGSGGIGFDIENYRGHQALMVVRRDTTDYDFEYPRHPTIVSGKTVNFHNEDDGVGDAHSKGGGSRASQCPTNSSLQMVDEVSFTEENDVPV
jgi:hypothetical protein